MSVPASSPTASVLGLGLIGSAWARHLHADGVLAAAWNRTPKPEQPGWEPDARAAAAKGDVVIVCVADPAAVGAVLDAVLPALGPGKLLVQTSTIDPVSAEGFRARVVATGARYLESPFTGSRPAAEQRQTVFFTGGDDADRAAAEPVLRRISRIRIPIGDGRAAASLKLALNLNLAIMMGGIVESLAFAREAGIGDDLYFACLRENVGWSGLAALKEPKLRAGDFSPQFSVRHLLKDVRLALRAGDPARLAYLGAAEQALAKLAAAGHADEDFCALMRGAAGPGNGR